MYKAILICIIICIASCHTNCNSPLKGFIDAAEYLNQGIQSFSHSLLQQQNNFMNEYEKILAPQLANRQKQNEYLNSANNQAVNVSQNNTKQVDSFYISLVDDINQQNNQNFRILEDAIVSRRYLQNAEQNQDQNQEQNDEKQSEVNNKINAFDDNDDEYLKQFMRNMKDEDVFHYYLKEQIQFERLYMKVQDTDRIDEEYQIVSHYIYTTVYQHKSYKIIQLNGTCNSKSQQVIQKGYFYFCDGRRIFVSQFLRNRKDPERQCYKQVYYTEACLCPNDKFGIFCSDQAKIDCVVTTDTQALNNNLNNLQNDNKKSTLTLSQSKVTKQQYHQKQDGIFANKISKLDSQGFNLNMRCQTYIKMPQILNNRREVVTNGICPEGITANNDNKNGCYQQPFIYAYEDKENNLFVSDDISLKIEIKISNWKKLSQPFRVELFIQKSPQQILTGEQLLSIPLDFNELQQQNPQLNFQEFFQSGIAWYSLRITAVLIPTDYTQYEISVLQFNGILEQVHYIQPKLNYFQLLLINKWTFYDYVTVFLSIFLVLTFILFLYFLFKSLQKVQFQQGCTTLFRVLKRYFNKTNQNQTDNIKNHYYDNFNDEAAVRV